MNDLNDNPEERERFVLARARWFLGEGQRIDGGRVSEHHACRTLIAMEAERDALRAEVGRLQRDNDQMLFDTSRDAYAKTEGQLRCVIEDLTRQVREARNETAIARGDRCDVCDDDGLIYVEVEHHEIAEQAQVCPSCGGTRSGYASEVTKERDAARDRIEKLLATIVKVTNETPYPEELAGWEAQRRAMIAEVGTLRASLAAAERELERWRHGVPIEGDYVCPNEVALAGMKADALRRITEVANAADAELQRARSVTRDLADSLDKALCNAGAQPDTVGLFNVWKAARNAVERARVGLTITEGDGHAK